jgi:ABC-type uncharacterized transport system YnjBCD permease subunit
MVNAKRILLYLPLYVVWAVTVDVLFDSATPPGSKSVPAWMTVGFIASAVIVAGVVLWYLSRRAAGKVPTQRHHVYIALFVAIIVSGLVEDAGKGAAWLIIGSHPWWALVPICTIGYAALWVAFVLMANWLERRADDRNTSRA